MLLFFLLLFTMAFNIVAMNMPITSLKKDLKEAINRLKMERLSTGRQEKEFVSYKWEINSTCYG